MLTFRNLYKDVKEFQLNLHLQLVGTANSKILDCKKTPKSEAQQSRASEPKSTCTMCGRFFHNKDKCPGVESKYANKTGSLYVGLSHKFFLPPDCCLWGASLESEGISGVFLLGTGIKLFMPVSFLSFQTAIKNLRVCRTD